MLDTQKIKPQEGETQKVEWKQFWQIKDDPRLMPNLKAIIPLLFMDVRGWTLHCDISQTETGGDTFTLTM